MRRDVLRRCLRHDLCDGCGLVRGHTVVVIVVVVVVFVGDVLLEPGLGVRLRAVSDFRRRRSLLRAVNDFR